MVVQAILIGFALAALSVVAIALFQLRRLESSPWIVDAADHHLSRRIDHRRNS